MMYQGYTFLAIIPARSGSKGLPDKNIKSLCGKPLLAWSIESALDSKYIDEVVVSTDSSVYAEIAKDYGANVPFLRPKNLASDTTSTFDVLEHCIRFYKQNLQKEFDYIVLLEPTSPLRECDDIDNAIAKLIAQNASSLSTIGAVKEHPAILKRVQDNVLKSFLPTLPKTTRRQDNEPLYFPYGVAYIAKTTALLAEQTFYTKHCAYYEIKPHQCYEIDDICDFLCIEAMMKAFYPMHRHSTQLITESNPAPNATKSLQNTHTSPIESSLTESNAPQPHSTHTNRLESTPTPPHTTTQGDTMSTFLIIGLGSMGKRRVRNLIALGLQAHIIGFDVRSNRRKEAEEKYHIPTFDSLELAMEKHKIDVFIISTPPHLHMHYAEIAAKHNIHCFIEASVVEKERILALSKRANQDTLIIPSSTMYFSQLVENLRALLERKTIGAILSINYHTGQYLPSWHPWEDISDFYVSRYDTGGGREIVPFELTWLCALFGKANALSGLYGKYSDMHAPISDLYHALLCFESGIALNLTIEVLSQPKASRELRILGSEGIIHYTQDTNCLSYINTTMQDWAHIPFEQGTIEAQYINPEEPYIKEMQAFLNALNHNDPSLFPNTLEKDATILDLLESIESKSQHFPDVFKQLNTKQLNTQFNGGGGKENMGKSEWRGTK